MSDLFNLASLFRPPSLPPFRFYCAPSRSTKSTTSILPPTPADAAAYICQNKKKGRNHLARPCARTRLASCMRLPACPARPGRGALPRCPTPQPAEVPVAYVCTPSVRKANGSDRPGATTRSCLLVMMSSHACLEPCCHYVLPASAFGHVLVP